MGNITRSIKFYNKLSKHLTDHGFVQNKYGMCTFNKIVNGERGTNNCSIPVENLKVSHGSSCTRRLSYQPRGMSLQEDKLTENKGLVHKYLGITIDYSIPR